MKLVYQTLFGGPHGPREEIGNCYPACVASLLELPLADVPHVHQIHAGDIDRAHAVMTSFLASKNRCHLNLKFGSWCADWLSGVLAIFGGKSPRGDWDHAVIGEITLTGWKPIFDPHPERRFLAAEPTDIEIIFEPMKFTRLTEAA